MTASIAPERENLISPSAPVSGFRFGRAAALSLACAVFFGLVEPIIDFKLGNTLLGAQHFAPGAVGALLILTLINPLLGGLNRHFKLSRDELLVVYLSCLFTALVPGVGGHNLWPMASMGPFYYAKPENGWMEILQKLPSWVSPALDQAGNYRPDVTRRFFEGLAPGQHLPWGAWIVPSVVWMSVTFVTFLLTGCLSVMLRAQWVEHEALSFPLLKVPLEMTENTGTDGGPTFWRNPVMWVGFGIAFGIQFINSLHVYFPDVPGITLDIAATPFIQDPPMNQTGIYGIRITPMVVGIAFLLAADVSFSLWFFFWFIKLQYVGAYYLGYMPNSLESPWPFATKMFTGYQEVGAYLGITALVLWSARRQLLHIMRRAFGREKAKPSEKDEPLSFPLAFWGALLSFLFLVAWGILMGAHPIVVLAYWASFIIVSVVFSRILAESGLILMTRIHDPFTVVGHFSGMGAGTMMGQNPAANVFLGMAGDMRGCHMPQWLQAFKLISLRRLPARPLFGLFCGCVFVAMVLGAWTHIRIGYTGGTLSFPTTNWYANGVGKGTGDAMGRFIQSQPPQAALALVWGTVGVLLVFGMAFLRSRFPWFPLTPTVFPMAMTYPMHIFWLSITIGWAAKVLVMRWGGADAYKRVLPFFLGLVVGDVAAIVFWLCVDAVTGRVGHGLI